MTPGRRARARGRTGEPPAASRSAWRRILPTWRRRWCRCIAPAPSGQGLFGVHTWVAVEPTDARQWTVYEVVGWRLRSSASAGGRAQPAAMALVRRGAGALRATARSGRRRADRAHRRGGADLPPRRRVPVLARPNSSTFTSWIARSVPELEGSIFPATAIGGGLPRQFHRRRSAERQRTAVVPGRCARLVGQRHRWCRARYLLGLIFGVSPDGSASRSWDGSAAAGRPTLRNPLTDAARAPAWTTAAAGGSLGPLYDRARHAGGPGLPALSIAGGVGATAGRRAD